MGAGTPPPHQPGPVPGFALIHKLGLRKDSFISMVQCASKLGKHEKRALPPSPPSHTKNMALYNSV